MLLEKKVLRNKTAFLNKVTQMSVSLGINPDWLMVVFMLECSMDERRVNPYTGASGLIQFMPATAQSLGTTTALLQKMSNVQQLDYVYKYLKPFAGKMKSQADVYLAVFFPAAINQYDSFILKTSKLSPSLIASQNARYDLNHDNQITKGEVATYIESFKKKTTL